MSQTPARKCQKLPAISDRPSLYLQRAEDEANRIRKTLSSMVATGRGAAELEALNDAVQEAGLIEDLARFAKNRPRKEALDLCDRIDRLILHLIRNVAALQGCESVCDG